MWWFQGTRLDEDGRCLWSQAHRHVSATCCSADCLCTVQADRMLDMGFEPQVRQQAQILPPAST